VTLLRFLAQHWALTAAATLLLVLLLTAAALMAATRREPRTGRHSRAGGIYHGKPTEIRRHRSGGREHAWPGTFSVCVRPESTVHVLDEADEVAVRLWASRFEDTGEITQAGLAALFGPRSDSTGERPALVGAS
jgi:hypothetical protein